MTTRLFSKTRLALAALAAAALMAAAPWLAAQTRLYTFNALDYAFPASQTAGALTNDGAGTLTWSPAAGGLTETFRGLRLRTSPDADLAAHTVWATADQVTMDDGTVLAFTTPVTASVAAAGAGGLDTGSEGASRWYEAYAIAKDDGTKNLLLHRAKNYLLDQSQATNDGGNILRAASNDRVKIGQTFLAGVSGALEMADVSVDRDGSPTAEVWAAIYATDGTAPTGAALATSDKLNVAVMPATNGYVRFVFRTPLAVTASTTYALVLEGSYAFSGTDMLRVRENSAGGYAAGSLYFYDGSAWGIATGRDIVFRAYVTQNDAAVTMPADYTKKSKLGYAYNNAGSNLQRFVAQDRRVMADYGLNETATVAATIPTLEGISQMVPPGLVRLFTILSVSADGILVNVGPVPDGYAARFGSNVAVQGSAGVGMESTIGPVLVTEYQGVYIWSASGSTRMAMYAYEW